MLLLETTVLTEEEMELLQRVKKAFSFRQISIKTLELSFRLILAWVSLRAIWDIDLANSYLCVVLFYFLIVGGYSLVFDRDVPFELHVVDEEMVARVGHSVQADETMQVKICVKVSQIILHLPFLKLSDTCMFDLLGIGRKSWRHQGRNPEQKWLLLHVLAYLWRFWLPRDARAARFENSVLRIPHDAYQALQLGTDFTKFLQMSDATQCGQFRRSFLQLNLAIQAALAFRLSLRAMLRELSAPPHKVQTQNGWPKTDENGNNARSDLQDHQRQESISDQSDMQGGATTETLRNAARR